MSIEPGSPDWLGLGGAARLLGVAPQTLRRWSDAGLVATFTTPGGHRRYRRASLERMIAERPVARASLVGAGMTRSRLVRAYRQDARQHQAAMPWVMGLDDVQRDAFRSHGRQLAATLVAHLDAPDATQAEHHLADATAQAADYGRLVASLGVSLSQAVEGFLLMELSAVTIRRGFDATATTELIDAAERVMDRLLIAVMTAFSVRQVGTARRARVTRSLAARPL